MRILIVTTISNTVNAFLIPHIRRLVFEGHKVDVAFSTVQTIKNEVHDLGCCIYEIPFNRSPFNVNNLVAFKKLKKLVSANRYDVIHTHTPIASMIVRFVCKKTENTKVIYTAHGFHFYNGAPLINWLIYYPIEKMLSSSTDVIITINHEDYIRAKKKFRAKEIAYVPGVGIDLHRNIELAKSRDEMLREIGLPTESIVILSVGELNKNKNHRVVIEALYQINNKNIHYVICGKGRYSGILKKLAVKLGIGSQVHLLGYREDVEEILKLADVFAFPSLREGLPVSLMEAMIFQLPIVCSKIRGNEDLIQNNFNGFLIEKNDVISYKENIVKLLTDKELSMNFVSNSNLIIRKFDIENVLSKLDAIYKGVIND